MELKQVLINTIDTNSTEEEKYKKKEEVNAIINNLKNLKDEKYYTQEEFLKNLKAKIERDITENHKSLILKCALFQTDLALQAGINVYPNEQYYAVITNMLIPQNEPEDPKYIPTGIQNLDPLLPGGPGGKEQGFREGNSILVMGSPGSGKTLFGLHFLKVEEESPVLWLSFEGPKRSLERGVASFEESVGYKNLLNSPKFIFKFIPPALISPEKVLFYVYNLIKELNVKRIVIDSVSEIEEAFHVRKVRFRQFMTTFIHTLSSQNVTSMFLYRVSGFFRSSKESESELSTLVDTIISIKTFDMKNEIRRGLFVLKSRGREHHSRLQTMEILPKEGISLSYKGWEMEGLLSGDTGSIHEPEIFLKLFYENPAEQEINEEIIAEFIRRYPNKARFTEVRKPAIYSEFWSFRGDYGAGHSNIRVVSISMYMVEAFRELDRLHDLDDFFPEKLKQQIEKDFRWKRYCTERNTHDNIPVYTDIGLLVFRKDLLDKFKGAKNNVKEALQKSGLFKYTKSNYFDLEGEISWNSLKKLSSDLSRKDLSQSGNTPIYLFSLPYLYDQTEFMAFFFEILWSMGGDVYHFPIFRKQNGKTRMSFYKEQILINKAIWEKFTEIIKETRKPNIQKPKKSIYSVSEMTTRVKLLTDVFIKDYETIPDHPKEVENVYLELKNKMESLREITKDQAKKESMEKEFLEKFEKFLDKYVVKNIKKPLLINDNDVITINKKYAKEALTFIYELVFDSKGTIPNPYDGNFSTQSIFCRKWYSQIADLRQEIVSIIEFLNKLKKEGIPDHIISRLENLKLPTHTTEEKFKSALEEKIGEDDTDMFGTKIFNIFNLLKREKNLYIRALPYNTIFKLTTQSLNKLKEEGIPENIITKLRGLENQEYYTEEEFESTLEKIIGKEMSQYKSQILERGTRKKSCTAETVWSLGVIKEALSPEIGWIFIDTLTSKEWIENRAKNKRGFPHRIEDLKAMEHYDPEAYKILQEIIVNKEAKEQIDSAKTSLIKPILSSDASENDFEKYLDAFFKGKYHQRDIGDITKSLKRIPQEYSGRVEFFEKACEEKGINVLDIRNKDYKECSDSKNKSPEEKDRLDKAKAKLLELNLQNLNKCMDDFFACKYSERDIKEILNKMEKLQEKFTKREKTFKESCHKIGVDTDKINVNSVSELSDFEWSLTFRSKIQAHRPFFHRVESILHDEIVKLFSPQGMRNWFSTLCPNLDIKKLDEKINVKLQKHGLIEAALEHMHDRLIFDLLTEAPKEIQKAWASL